MLAGRSLPHAVMMMIPEAYAGPRRPARRPQGLLRLPLVPDGAVGRPRRGRASPTAASIGATLDRNGLRPGRWLETKDGWVVLGSETGDAATCARRTSSAWAACSRASSSSSTSSEGRIVDDEEVKREVATQQPYGEWFERAASCTSTTSRARRRRRRRPSCRRASAQLAFGYSQEDLRVLLAPMAREGRGADRLDGQRRRAGRALATSAPPLFNYFKQLFAQVTNPPIDPIREAIVMTLGTGVGAERNLLDETPEHAHQLVDGPADPAQRRARDAAPGRPPTSSRRTRSTSPGRSPRARTACAARWPTRLRRGRRRARRRRQHPDPLRPRASAPSARRSRRCWPSPPCTTTSCARARACSAGLVLESGEPREVHHFATLIGYGAQRDQPVPDVRVASTSSSPTAASPASTTPTRPSAASSRRIGKGLLKTISKMGISTIQSYCGAQIFEAVGLEHDADRPPLHRHRVADRRHRPRRPRAGDARPPRARRGPAAHDDLLPVGGVYAWRRDGEHHMWNPETIALLQHAGARQRRRAADSTTSTRGWSTRTPRAARRCAGCCKFRERPRGRVAARRGRARQGDRQALRHRRDVARLDLHARRTRRWRSR